jgi:hypothetical protein
MPLKKTAGTLGIAGAIVMFAGAAFWGASGADIWEALKSDNMEAYISQLSRAETFLAINTCLWILGALVLGAAISLISAIEGNAAIPSSLARTAVTAAVPLAILSFITMASLPFTLSAEVSSHSVQLVKTIGWIGTKADGLATFLLIAVCPTCLSLAGKTTWAPRWLTRWGYVAAFAGALLLIAEIAPSLQDLMYPVIPIGLGWIIAAGIVLVRKS